MNKNLKAIILNKITSNHGKISFAQFMDLALYAEQYGFYTQTKEKLGVAGDFITAPLVSPLFSHCLAEQCVEIFKKIPQANILEFGAGTGKMAADLLLFLEEKDSLPENYFIRDISQSLCEAQYKTLQQLCPHLLTKVTWLKDNEVEFLNNSFNHAFNGIILANELIDAMPVHLFEYHATGFQEVFVSFDASHDQFEFCLGDCEDPILKQSIDHLISSCMQLNNDNLPWEVGYRSEINLQIKPWINKISHILNQGIILIIDYGYPRSEYYHPQRNKGTLRCHTQHKVQDDPLLAVGNQDITAHVDFTAIAEAAIENHLDVLGYTNQAAFLLSCGLLELANSYLHKYNTAVKQNSPKVTEKNNDKSRNRDRDSNSDWDRNNLREISIEKEKRKITINHAIQKLTAPQEMGEIFKVMALGKHYSTPLKGFSLNNKIQTL